MGFSDVLGEMLGYGPSNRAADQVNQARAGQTRQLQNEYTQAQADPNSGIGLSPAQQQQMEQELGNHIRGQMSDQGAGGSGSSNDAVQKGIVDYRIAQMGKHMQHLDSLRQGMIQASTPQTHQPTPGANLVQYGAGRAGQALGQDLFGAEDPNKGRMNVTINSPSPGQNPQGQDSNGKTNGYV